MAYRNDFIDQINTKLLVYGISVNMPEHKFKKSSDIFNNVLREVHAENKDREINMYHILLSLNEYFDMSWLKDNVLDRKNIETIEKEMQKEYNIKKPD